MAHLRDKATRKGTGDPTSYADGSGWDYLYFLLLWKQHFDFANFVFRMTLLMVRVGKGKVVKWLVG